MPDPATQGHVAVVTGASSGIGEAVARRLAAEPGMTLVLVARREERLRALAEALPVPATYVAADLTGDDAPARVRDHVLEHHGRLSLLVNNAGASWRATFAEGGYANVRRTMDVNFDAVVRLTEALLPTLRASAPSAIVNVLEHVRADRAAAAPAPTRPASSRWRAGRDALYARGASARRPRGPGAARLRRDGGLPRRGS